MLVEEPADQFGRVSDCGAAIIKNFGLARMPHALRDHQAVNPARRHHVAVEQTSAFPAENAVASRYRITRMAPRVPASVRLPTPSGNGRKSGCLGGDRREEL